MKLGDIITVDVDPDTNGGSDQAAALVTQVHDDGSYNVRVFRNGITNDEFLTHQAAPERPAPAVEPGPAGEPAHAAPDPAGAQQPAPTGY